jgi:elongation factor G
MVIPIGKEENFEGVIDLIKMKRDRFDEATQGHTMVEGPIPDDLVEEAKKWRHNLIEKAAEQDDALLEKYLGGAT